MWFSLLFYEVINWSNCHSFICTNCLTLMTQLCPDISHHELKMHLNHLFAQNLNFFSGMESPRKLGQIIEMANRENTYEEKGLKFLNLLKRS